MTFSDLSDSDLNNIEKGNYSALSKEALDLIDQQASARAHTYKPKDGLDFLLTKAGIAPESLPAKLAKALLPIPLAAADLSGNIAQNVAATPGHPFQALTSAVNAEPGQIGAAGDIGAGIGQFANKGNQQAADLMRQNLGGPGKLAGALLGGTSNMLMPQSRTAALLSPLMAGASEKAADAGLNIAADVAKRTTAQGLKISSGIMEDASKQLLENPVAVLTAPTSKEAGKKIADLSAGKGLKTGIEGFKEVFKSGAPPTPSEVIKLADESLVGGDFTAALTPQEAVSHLQAVNHVELLPKYQNPLNRTEMAYLQMYKTKLQGLLEDWGHGDLVDSIKDYRYSKVKDQILGRVNSGTPSLLPVNKYGDASVLRGLAGLAGVGASEAQSRYSQNKSNPLRDILAAALFAPAIAGPSAGLASLAGSGASAISSFPLKAALMGAMQKQVNE